LTVATTRNDAEILIDYVYLNYNELYNLGLCNVALRAIDYKYWLAGNNNLITVLKYTVKVYLKVP